MSWPRFRIIKGQRLQLTRPVIRAVLAGFLLTCLLLPAGCTSTPDQPGTRGDELSEVIQDGIPIPRFSSATDQLNYAKSGLNDRKRKLAAFRAVQTLFPEDRAACGHAALGLAYLHLEPQYRFASPRDIRQAARDFLTIAKSYKDLTEIRAKALWYLGWIHTDLEMDLQTGMGYYWQLVNTLPQVPMNLSPTAPWVNLVYGSKAAPKAPKTAPPEPTGPRLPCWKSSETVRKRKRR